MQRTERKFQCPHLTNSELTDVFVQMAYVEWVGENVNGMKKSYILRNKSQTTDLFGYTHFTFRHSDKAELDAEMTGQLAQLPSSWFCSD